MNKNTGYLPIKADFKLKGRTLYHSLNFSFPEINVIVHVFYSMLMTLSLV